MSKIRFFPAFFLVLAFVAISCGNSSQSGKNRAPEAGAETPSSASTPKQPVSPSLAVIDTQRPINPAPERKRPNVPETGPQDYSKLPGPKGFVVRDQAVLRQEPSEKSVEIAKLKKHETIYLLDATMKDETGKVTQYPTWYKVQLENKKSGWVSAASVDVGGGG